jgi:hypothetical protein
VTEDKGVMSFSKSTLNLIISLISVSDPMPAPPTEAEEAERIVREETANLVF